MTKNVKMDVNLTEEELREAVIEYLSTRDIEADPDDISFTICIHDSTTDDGEGATETEIYCDIADAYEIFDTDEEECCGCEDCEC